jgi:hypothetical protein
VTEPDEAGIPVDEEDFGYVVMISNEKVTLTADDYEDEVIITNIENPEGEELTEGPDDETEPLESEELTEVPDARNGNDETEPAETEILTEETDDESEPIKSSEQTENGTSNQNTSPVTSESSGTESAPRTADDTKLNQWMVLLFLSGIGVISIAVTRKKKKHRVS